MILSNRLKKVRIVSVEKPQIPGLLRSNERRASKGRKPVGIFECSHVKRSIGRQFERTKTQRTKKSTRKCASGQKSVHSFDQTRI